MQLSSPITRPLISKYWKKMLSYKSLTSAYVPTLPILFLLVLPGFPISIAVIL